ncbi:MAG: ABZJ_00895 family protein [Pseudomonadota bacterium]
MPEPTVNLLRYSLWFLGTGFVLTLFVILFQQAFGIGLGMAFMPILPAIVAAMVEGSKYAKSTRTPIPDPWKAAGAMTGLSIALTALLIVTTALPTMGTNAFDLTALVMVLGIYAAFWLVSNRLFLSMGARNEWASQDRGSS